MAKQEGEWRTIKGRHVLIGGDGTVLSGPKELKGKKIGSGKSTSSKSSTSKGKPSSTSKKQTSLRVTTLSKQAKDSGWTTGDLKTMSSLDDRLSTEWRGEKLIVTNGGKSVAVISPTISWDGKDAFSVIGKGFGFEKEGDYKSLKRAVTSINSSFSSNEQKRKK